MLLAMMLSLFNMHIGYTQSAVKSEVNYCNKPASKGCVRALPEVSKIVDYYKGQLNLRKIERDRTAEYVDLRIKLKMIQH